MKQNPRDRRLKQVKASPLSHCRVGHFVSPILDREFPASFPVKHHRDRRNQSRRVREYDWLMSVRAVTGTYYLRGYLQRQLDGYPASDTSPKPLGIHGLASAGESSFHFGFGAKSNSTFRPNSRSMSAPAPTKRPFRRLLPATAGTAGDNPPVRHDPVSLVRRSNTRVACEACRRRKSKVWLINAMT